jgi:nucleoside-diphosphate-sugar epimerase
LTGATGDRFLVTGGQGFLGAWIARRLLSVGAPCALFDLARDDRILEQVLDPGALEGPARLSGDVAEAGAVERAAKDWGATRIIHLAGLQVPACRADPLRGARVNVLGTLNVFDAALRSGGQVKSVVYASSAGVAGPAADYPGPIPDDASHVPRTQYGVFKRANEGSALVFWLDHGIPSAGLRPLAIYGVGREIGITSGPTKAIKAAVAGRSYTIPFSGTTGFNYVEDVADVFIGCARAPLEGAHALNVRGEVAPVDAFARAIEAAVPEAAGKIGVTGPPIPIACDFVETGLQRLLGRVPRTPLAEGVRRTADGFRRLAALGKLRLEDLET